MAASAGCTARRRGDHAGPLLVCGGRMTARGRGRGRQQERPGDRGRACIPSWHYKHRPPAHRGADTYTHSPPIQRTIMGAQGVSVRMISLLSSQLACSCSASHSLHGASPLPERYHHVFFAASAPTQAPTHHRSRSASAHDAARSHAVQRVLPPRSEYAARVPASFLSPRWRSRTPAAWALKS